MNRVIPNDPRDAWMAEVFRARAEDPGPRNDCPDPERIWDAVRLQLSLDKRLEVIDHLAECPTCAEAWSLAAELAPSDAHVTQPHVNVSRRSSAMYNRSALVVGAAAMLVIALGVALITFRPQARPAEVAVTLQPRNQVGSALPQQDFVLRWSSGPAGSRYDVSVMTSDLKVVAEGRDLKVTEYQVPPERLGMAAGTELLWRVVARTPQGATISSSLFAVTVLPAPATAVGDSDEAQIRRLVATYRPTIERQDIERLRAINPGLSEPELVALQKAMGGELGWRIRIEGQTATAILDRVVRADERFFVRAEERLFRFEKTDAGNWVPVDPSLKGSAGK